MRKLALILLAITTFFYIACKKESSKESTIYGKWKLTETLADPGDGSGKYMPVKGAAKYVVLEESGKISGEAFPEAISFKIVDSIRLEITFKDRKEPASFRYKVSGSILEINPPCIEQCGLRFRRD
jgi:hypothetical protein